MNVITAFCIRLIAAMANNLIVKLLLIAVAADMVFGSARAIKERHWNSSVGIDGAVRKAGMVASIVLFTAMDMILTIDLLSWLPVDARDALGAVGIVKAGCTELFGILYVLYEATSVLKNMLLCGLPVPAGIREKRNDWLAKMTDETATTLKEKTHLMIPVHLLENDLEDMTREDLLDMVQDMGLTAKDDATKEDLIHMLCAETVYV